LSRPHRTRPRRAPLAPDEKAVFLNIPYDRRYEPLFIALVAALLALGRKPRCTLELSDRGQGRPSRIFEIMEQSRVSLHDLSRVGTPARFNMPFELGLAFALSQYWGQHDWYVLEARAFRIQKTLSDLKITEEHVHRKGPRIAISCVFDALGTPRNDPDPSAVDRLRRKMAVVAADAKRRYGRHDLFYRAAYLHFMKGSIELARRGGFIRG
jgi:hypothetical protein